MIIAATLIKSLRYEPEDFIVHPIFSDNAVLTIIRQQLLQQQGLLRQSLFGRCFGSGFCSSFSSFLSASALLFLVYLLSASRRFVSFLSFILCSRHECLPNRFVCCSSRLRTSISFSFFECAFATPPSKCFFINDRERGCLQTSISLYSTL